jgi:hypothetical protein
MKYIILAILVSLLTIHSYGQTGPDSYIGGGLGVTNSTSFHGETTPNIFAIAQKRFGRLTIKGLAEFKSEPELPNLFQSDKGADPGDINAKMNGFEFRARPEIDVRLFQRGPLQPYIGLGFDFFAQRYKDEPGGSAAHYHEGLNPITSLGARIGNHSLEATRIWQELKVKSFQYDTCDGVDAKGQCIPDPGWKDKGTLNPAYLDGWRLGYRYLHPLNQRLSLLLGSEISSLEYKKALARKTATHPGYVSYYLERDTIFTARVGIVFGYGR